MIHGVVLLGTFAIFWFLVFFMLLPIGIGSADPETGAPHSPKLLQKAGFATLAAVVLWGVFYALILAHILDL